jgi:hypothetical protein
MKKSGDPFFDVKGKNSQHEWPTLLPWSQWLTNGGRCANGAVDLNQEE